MFHHPSLVGRRQPRAPRVARFSSSMGDSPVGSPVGAKRCAPVSPSGRSSASTVAYANEGSDDSMSPTSGYQTAGSGAKPHTGKKVSHSATSQGSMGAPHHAASYPGEAGYGHHGGYSAEPGSRRLPVLPEERKPEEDPYHLTEQILSLREEIDCLGQQLHATQIGVTTSSSTRSPSSRGRCRTPMALQT
jgi:hypothetical protein